MGVYVIEHLDSEGGNLRNTTFKAQRKKAECIGPEK